VHGGGGGYRVTKAGACSARIKRAEFFVQQRR